MFQYFITIFNNKVKEENATQNELVIRAFGAFAAPCRSFMKQQDVLFMLTVVMQKAEDKFFRSEQFAHFILH
ncbi:hypothetical protein L9F63_015221, partial [Diploptera punctata]